MGAILDSHHPLRGMVAGAIGGAVSETVAEWTKPHLGHQWAGNAGILSGPLAALLAGQDVDVASATASNAIVNNFFFVPAIPYVLGALAVGGTAWTAYDVYDTYQQHGPEAALKQAGVEVAIIGATGGVGKIAYKIGKTAYPTAQAAWKAYARTNPKLLEIVEKSVIKEEKYLNVKVNFKEGMNPRDYERKIKSLERASQESKLVTNIPHGVTPAERAKLTREYRQKVVQRINSLYKDNHQARESALRKLQQSDIDHTIDLQLGGQNIRKNLKSLDSKTNQGIGSQISTQLPKGEKIKVNIINETN